MQAIKVFLKGSEFEAFEIELASEDASFRKYYRLIKEDKSFILMDSSKELNSLISFVKVTKLLLDTQVKAPQIYMQDLEKGFLVLEDFGSTDLLDVLDEENFESLYKIAIDEILKMQKSDAQSLPLYDAAFLKLEMDLMQEWFLTQYMQVQMNNDEINMLEETLETISNEVLKQPQGIFVHRDFHSRNIMYMKENTLGIIDYQDAMNGAITYDLVSLLRDLYICFESKKVEGLALYFRDKKGLRVSDTEFMRWFDFMGLQRHIKVLGIFARLSLRDGKNGYLKDLPLTLQYVLKSAKKYDETKRFYEFLKPLSLKDKK